MRKPYVQRETWPPPECGSCVDLVRGSHVSFFLAEMPHWLVGLSEGGTRDELVAAVDERIDRLGARGLKRVRETVSWLEAEGALRFQDLPGSTRAKILKDR